MQHNPSKGSFSKCGESYEKLLIAARAGNLNAANELLKNLFDIRLKVGRGISPTIVKLLDSWEFNHAFFEAYSSLCKTYREENGCSVRTYFSTLLKNAMIAEASSSAVFQRLNTLSLDDERSGPDGESYTLGDMIAGKPSVQSDVTYYIDFVDSYDRFSSKEHSLSKMEKTIVKLRSEGLTYEQIGEILSISITKARSAFMKFYNAVLDTIQREETPRFKKDFDVLTY